MRIFLFTNLFLFVLSTVYAQDSTGSENNTSFISSQKIIEGDGMLSLNLSLPSEDMMELTRNNMFGSGFGGSLLFLSNPGTWGKNDKNTVLRIGGELGYTYYGRFITDVNINGYRGDYKTSYGIAHLNAILRLRPPEVGPIVPFGDFFIGGNFYFSTIKENLDAIETSLGLEPFNFGGTSSASFVKGAAAGISIGSRNPLKARLILRVSYAKGSSLRYIVRNSLEFDPNYNSLTYQTNRAPVEYFLAQVGIGL